MLNFIKNFKKNKRVLFTTPSHNQGAFIIPNNLQTLGKKIFEADYSEIDGLDDLSDPKGIILESEKTAAKIYGSKYSFYLVNGSTSGNLAAMLALLSCGDKVLIASNCHRSINNGVTLTKSVPIYLESSFDDEWGIPKAVDSKEVDKILGENLDIKAFIMTSPTYEGVKSDVKSISAICKKHGVFLIVDEAHGALWSFNEELGTPSIKAGADISVQSLHKTAGALNPSAIMHVTKSTSIDPKDIKTALNLITTTSPSYPILLNIENTVNFLASSDGKEKIKELSDNIADFKKCLKHNQNLHFYDTDPTKLLVKIDGLSGYELSKILDEKYNIEDELATSGAVPFLTGIGTTKQKLKKLCKALGEIAAKAVAKQVIASEANANQANYL